MYWPVNKQVTLKHCTNLSQYDLMLQNTTFRIRPLEHQILMWNTLILCSYWRDLLRCHKNKNIALQWFLLSHLPLACLPPSPKTAFFLSYLPTHDKTSIIATVLFRKFAKLILRDLETGTNLSCLKDANSWSAPERS